MSRISHATASEAQFKASNVVSMSDGAKAISHLIDSNIADKTKLVSRKVVRGSVRMADFLIASLLGFAIALLYLPAGYVFNTAFYSLAILATAALTVTIFEILGLYKVAKLTQILGQMSRLVLGWTGAFCVLVATVFFLKAGEDLSRVWLAAWYLLGGFALIAGRLAVSKIATRWTEQGRLFRKAVVFGFGDVMTHTLDQLAADQSNDIRIAGVFDDRNDERREDDNSNIVGLPNRGNLKDLVAFARGSRVDVVILALPLSAEKRISQAIEALSVLPVDIKIPAEATKLHFSARTYSRVGSIPMIDMYDHPIRDWGSVAKAVFDIGIATVATILLAPVLAAVAIAVKLDSPGPIFFRQKRYGLNNELIEVFKFRSMHTKLCDASAQKLVTKDDPRVTRVGKFIRKTSLDELPQLFNVIRGDLSLVGPRPHALQAKADNRLYDEVVENYFARHKVKPGITGWAQINGWRGETDTEEKIEKRVEYDLYYIENWSVFFDLYILLKTPLALFKSENAY